MNILSNGQLVSANNGRAYINGNDSGDGGIGYCYMELPSQYKTYYHEELHEVRFEVEGMNYEFIDRSWTASEITISFTANPYIEESGTW
jgi:hypothetical protein